MGLIFDSCVFPFYYPEDKSKISIFFGDKVKMSLKDKDIIDKGVFGLYKMLGVDADPVNHSISKWDNFFPIY